MPLGAAVIKRLSTVLAANELPPYLAQLLMRLHAHYLYLVEQIIGLEAALEQELSREETGQRLQTIPGVGPITASVLSSQLGDGKQYGCSRDFAASTAWCHGSTAREAKICFQGLVNAEIKTCDGYLFRAPESLSRE